MYWALHRWRPQLAFSVESLRRMFRFGGFMAASSLLDVVGSRLYGVLIARLYSPADLGIYSRALSTKDFPQTLFALIFSRVAFPAMSRHADNPAKLKSGLRTANIGMMAISSPAMAGLAVTAHLLIPVLFGPQWRPAAPLLTIVCLAGLLWPLQVTNLSLIQATGRSDIFFRLEIAKKVLLVSLTIGASFVSVVAVAWTTVLLAAISFGLNAIYAGNVLGYGPLRQLRDVAPYGLTAGLMATAVLLLNLATASQSDWLRLILAVATGAVIYLGLGLALRLEAFTQGLIVAREMLRRRAA